MKIGIVGAGYVGLVAGACFAEFGHHVTCVDIDDAKVKRLNNGEIPIFEPGLTGYVQRNIEAGRLHFSSDIAQAALGNQFVMLAVGTPPRESDGAADMRFVEQAAIDLAAHLEEGTIVVTKSTVPVKTGDRIRSLIEGVRPDLVFHVASNPEFLREGAAIDDFVKPDRVVIGLERDGEGRLPQSLIDRFRELYRPMVLDGVTFQFMDRRTAELVKYAANAFLAMKVTFINEVADLCEKLGANVEDVSQGIGSDRRIGRLFLKPGPGFGGSCFPKDAMALAQIGSEAGVDLKMVSALIDRNTARKEQMARRVIDLADGELSGKTVAILGLTFKAGTDDMREAPSLTIVQRLLEHGATVRAFDPEGMDNARRLMPEVIYCHDADSCMKDSDITVILTDWAEFQSLDPREIAALMRGNMLLDLRNVLDPLAARNAGLVYSSIGR